MAKDDRLITFSVTPDSVLVFVRHLCWLAALAMSVTGVLVLIWFGSEFGGRLVATGLLCLVVCLFLSAWRNVRAHGSPFPDNM